MMHEVSLTTLTLPKQQYTSHFIEEHKALLLYEDEARVEIGLCEDRAALRNLLYNFHHGKEITFKKIDELDLSNFLNRYSVTSDENIEPPEEQEPEELASAPYYIRLVSSILTNAINARASDIHIEGFNDYCIIRFRLDGVLQETERFKASQFAAIASRIKIMANLNIMQNRLPQDGRLTFNGVDMRLSIIPLAAGESIVLRLLDRQAELLTPEHLGFPTQTLAFMHKMVRRPHGLFIITGPTGSGKTTSLISLLKNINSSDKKIISIEDPIEYVITGIDQVQANEEIGLTFSSLLRRCLRQDPDIIFVGEMRDQETAELAIRAALTGHLVLSTLHTNDAVSSIIRLQNMGIEPYLIAGVLAGVMAQRLMRLLCPHCKKAVEPLPVDLGLFQFYHLEPPTVIYEATGCPACRHTGYQGRLAVSEHFSMSKSLEAVIAKEQQTEDITRLLEQEGYQPLIFQALALVAQGKTSVKEVERILIS